MGRRGKVGIAAALLVLGLLSAQIALVATAPPMVPVARPPLAPDAASAPVDDALWIARLFAPRFLHETHPTLGRQDIPAAMDLDGDRDGTNNWETFPDHKLLPTVYYTVVETETHSFVSYHLYHPRDWARVELGLQDTHEGDGENVQVVASKATMRAVLLTTQAHYAMWSYAPYPGPIQSGRETLRGAFDDEERPRVFVESGGHGMYGAGDPRASNRLGSLVHPVVVYRPQQDGEPLREPGFPWSPEEVPYRLVSLPAFLGGRTDHPGLFAGDVDGTPRYHKGDRYSGPLGPSRGISPFALSYGWSRGETGSLFWDPAATYASALRIEGDWSLRYVAHPFAPDRVSP